VGRADDVIKVCGHRLGTAEIEAAISTFPGVVESAVIAVPDAIKGNDIVAFIVAKESLSPTDIKQHIHHMFGPIGVPKDIVFVPDLPKTRSGKIVRRILRNLYLGEQIGDTSALANPEIMEHLLEISRPV
jgi:acetyl-CoA synthetase